MNKRYDDGTTAQPRQPSASPAPTSRDRRRWFGLVVVSLGVSLIIVDATIVNVAIPSIIRDIGLTSTQAQWVQEVYTLVFASLLLVFGRLSDRFGRRLLFAVGIMVFAVASVAAALAGSGGALIGARAIQGIGGAMILPASLSLINATFRGPERGIAFGVWGATIGGTAALGPLLGGWLTTSYSWRWAFGINIPFAVVVLTGLFLFLRESRDSSAVPGTDVGGAVLASVGFGGMVFALIEGRTYGWLTALKPVEVGSWQYSGRVSIVPVAFVAGLLALAVFALLERRRGRLGKAVLLDLRLFSIVSFRNGNIAAAIVSLGEFGLLFSLPLWLQNVASYTAFETGLVLLFLAGGSFLASGLGAGLARTRGPVFVVRAGIALEVIGVGGLALALRADSTWVAVAPFLFAYGIGVGFATAQLTGVVLTDVPVERSGQASGTQSTSRQVGAAFGIAILGTVLFLSLQNSLDTQLTEANLPAAERAQVIEVVVASAGSAIPELAASPATKPLAAASREAFTEATRWSAATATAFLLLGLAASASLGAPGAAKEESAVISDRAGEAGSR